MDPKIIEELNKAFGEFKSEHAKGKAADAGVLARIEANIADLDAKNAAAVKAAASRVDAIEAKLGRAAVGTAGSRDEKAAERKNAFLAMCRFGNPGRDPEAEAKWTRFASEMDAKIEAKSLIVADDTAGGYLAPPEYVKEILKAIVLVSPMRGIVKVRPTGQRSVQQPKRTGTAAAQWVGESTTRTETQNPSWGMTEIPTHELTAEVYVSFQDLEDSVFDLEGELNGEFSEQFGVSEGAAIVSGNGVGKPFGLLDAGQAIATTGTGQATIASATGAKGDAIINLAHAVKTGYAANGRFLLNRQTLGSVRKLTDSQGRYIWEPSIAVGMPSTINGAPYTETPDMPNEGAGTTPIAFGDFKRAYTMVDRLSMSVVRDPYTRAGVGQVKFVARRRVGGQVVLAEAIRLLKCA